MLIEFATIIILCIIAIGAVVYAFMPTIQDDGQRKRLNKILPTAKASSAQNSATNKEQKSKKQGANESRDTGNSKSVRLLRRGQEILKTHDALENSELRFKLAQAGYRSTSALAIYVIFKFIGPFILATLTALYIYFFFPDIVKIPLRYTLFIMMAFAVGYYLPTIWINNTRTKRQAKIKEGYPDMIDLVMICTESGMSAELAFRRVCDELGEENQVLQQELEILTAELSYLGERRLAYDNFAKRTDLPQIRALTTMIIQAEQYGTPVSQALRIISEESRDERMSEAERKAASLPSKLTVPMMLFFMPTLFVVIMTPAVLQIMDNF